MDKLMNYLADRKGQWRAIAALTGTPYYTVWRLGHGHKVNSAAVERLRAWMLADEKMRRALDELPD
jgi:hypothetical protein